MSQRSLVWFVLLDSTTDQPYNGCIAETVSIASSAYVADFRNAVMKKYEDQDSIFQTGIVSSQLLVYKNKATFEKRNGLIDEDKEEPLESSHLVYVLEKQKKNPSLSSSQITQVGLRIPISYIVLGT